MKDIIVQGLKGIAIICPVKLFGKPPKEIHILLGDCNSCDGVLKESEIKINSSLHLDYGMYNTGNVVYGKDGCGMKVLSEPQELSIYK